MNKQRYLDEVVGEFCFGGHKMAWISGPRQCGKTTFARDQLLADRGCGSYLNWDELEFRRQWASSPSGIVPSSAGGKIPMLVLDEIHKDKRWKRTLKGVYDTLGAPCDIVVTGSARLNVYNKGGDSLLGRYFHFRLHPFSLGELHRRVPAEPDEFLESLSSRPQRGRKARRRTLDQLLQFGPFPQPFLEQNERAARVWRRNRHDLIIREDLRDISRIPELARIEMFAAVLPETVGGPYTCASLGRFLEAAIPTVKRWISYLNALYFVFEIKPWSKHIRRSLKREGKLYLWDYAEVKDEGGRFENMVALHLKKAVDYWNDSGQGEFELYYLRNRQAKEIDFLIVRDSEPWLPVEVKLSETTPAKNWATFLPQLPCPMGLQVVNRPGVWQEHESPDGSKTILVASAEDVLLNLV
jgi:uncharacterized protein